MVVAHQLYRCSRHLYVCVPCCDAAPTSRVCVDGDVFCCVVVCRVVSCCAADVVACLVAWAQDLFAAPAVLDVGSVDPIGNFRALMAQRTARADGKDPQTVALLGIKTQIGRYISESSVYYPKAIDCLKAMREGALEVCFACVQRWRRAGVLRFGTVLEPRHVTTTRVHGRRFHTICLPLRMVSFVATGVRESAVQPVPAGAEDGPWPVAGVLPVVCWLFSWGCGGCV
jgi:hypothetical protein